MTASEVIRVLEKLQLDIAKALVSSPVEYDRYRQLVGEHRGLERAIDAVRKIDREPEPEPDFE